MAVSTSSRKLKERKKPKKSDCASSRSKYFKKFLVLGMLELHYGGQKKKKINFFLYMYIFL